MSQVGIPLFYLQGMGGGAVLKFRDLFNDNSLFWGWRKFLGESTTGKTGTEAFGRYSFVINDGINGEWSGTQNQGPRIFTGVLAFPCEIKTRLDTFSGNLYSVAGLFVSHSPTNFGGMIYYSIAKVNLTGVDGIAVMECGNILASTLVTTLPIWFRIRLGCTSRAALSAYFDYSLDGLNWTNLWAQNVGVQHFSISGGATGIYASNFATKPATSASFDFFEMKPKSIN